MLGNGAGIYMMNKCTAPIVFFEEVAGLSMPGIVALHVVGAAILHFA